MLVAAAVGPSVPASLSRFDTPSMVGPVTFAKSHGAIVSHELMWFRVTWDGVGSELSKRPFLSTLVYRSWSWTLRENFSLCKGTFSRSMKL